MRKWILAVLAVFVLAVPVLAFTGASHAESITTVESDGSCQITLRVQLQIEEAVQPMLFPLPSNAADITVNGQSLPVSYGKGSRNVDISQLITVPGRHELTIRYHIEDAIESDGKEGLFLRLELLSGFGYPIDAFSFRITLPDAPKNTPAFSSAYYQNVVETMMDVTVEGNVIQGVMTQRLQDHEMLHMQLQVDEKMFPQPMVKRWSMDTVDVVMIGVTAAALLYWLVFLRCAPLRRIRSTTLPDAITAGEIGCCLTQQGVDFSLMVLSWARMGYLVIQPTANGRILLHKRMDMYNERDEFESGWFRKLFGRREVVDGAGYHYAKIAYRTSRFTPGLHHQFQRGSGNPRVFRALSALIGSVGGISLAAAYAPDTLSKTVLSVVLGIVGFLAAWWMQVGARSIHSRHKGHLVLAIFSAAGWLLLSINAGEWNVALTVIVLEAIAGAAAFYGGRRNETGRETAGEILGLRHYIRTVEPEELERNMKINPNYYYELAPYAMALGLDRHLAKRMGKIRLPDCPYMQTQITYGLTAQEWNKMIRKTIFTMDTLKKRVPLDRLLGK